MEKRPVRLHLGARDQRVPEFFNVDMEPRPGVDLVGNAENLSLFDDNSVEEILASHILEHFPHGKTVQVLKEWCRVLKPGGLLYVAVPDFKRIVEIYQKIGGVTQYIQDEVMCGQEYPTAYHYSIFDFPWLEAKAKEAGFSEISQVEFFHFGLHDCSNRVCNIDGKPVSLNCVAIK